RYLTYQGDTDESRYSATRMTVLDIDKNCLPSGCREYQAPQKGSPDGAFSKRGPVSADDRNRPHHDGGCRRSQVADLCACIGHHAADGPGRRHFELMAASLDIVQRRLAETLLDGEVPRPAFARIEGAWEVGRVRHGHVDRFLQVQAVM